jgi:hypothetical protein
MGSFWAYSRAEKMPSNILYYGDNLEVLRNEIKDESVDLVYPDLTLGGLTFKKAQRETPDTEQKKMF